MARIKHSFEFGDIVEFIDKKSDGEFSHDGKYEVLDCVLMKDPRLGIWIDAYVYCRNDEDSDLLFVRSVKDMEEKFKKSK